MQIYAALHRFREIDACVKHACTIPHGSAAGNRNVLIFGKSGRFFDALP
jgi:hypothetical protein